LIGFQESTSNSPINNTKNAIRLGLKYQTILSEYQFMMQANDPFWRHHYSRLYRAPFWYGYYPYPRGRDLLWYSGWDAQYRMNYLHQLEITMNAAETGKKLVTLRASTEQTNPEISLQMPFLIRSALKDFPGVNGSTSTVVLPAASK